MSGSPQSREDPFADEARSKRASASDVHVSACNKEQRSGATSFAGQRVDDLAVRRPRWHRCGMGEHAKEVGDPFLHLKESIGSLMFLWCRLDEALSDALQDRTDKARRKMGGNFHDRLVRLKAVADRELEGDPTRAAKMCGLLPGLTMRGASAISLFTHSPASAPIRPRASLTSYVKAGRVPCGSPRRRSRRFSGTWTMPTAAWAAGALGQCCRGDARSR